MVLTAERESCRLVDAGFSGMPNCRRRYMFLLQLELERFSFQGRLAIVLVLV